jgi:hypothetical protein
MLCLALPSIARGQATIDTVIVVSRDVFDPPGDTPRFVARLGNALHITTHPGVVRRLLVLDAGTTLDSARLVESERALREVGVFRSVQFDTLRVGDRLALRVETSDGWSTSPQLNFSTAGGSSTWSAAFVERNFLGTATYVSVAYGKSPDRSSFDAQFASPGLLMRHAPLLIAYSDLSDGRIGAWRYGLPFYRTEARWSLVTGGVAARHRVLEFTHPTGSLITDSAQHRLLSFWLQGGVALRADVGGYLRLWGGAAWRREMFAPYGSPLVDSSFGTVGLGIEAARVRYGVYTHLNGFAREEDVNLSSALRIGAWAAPRAWGYPAGRSGIGPEASGQIAARWRDGFALVRVEGHGLDSVLVHGSLDVVSTRLARQAWLLHLEAGALRHPAFGQDFDPWVTQNGPRGFGAHAFTGTRLVYAVLEDRILLSDALFGVLGIGAAPYVEYGGAWYGDRGEAARLGGDVGVALRLGSGRSVRGDVAEIAVSYRFGDGFRPGGPWALSFRRSYSIK